MLIRRERLDSPAKVNLTLEILKKREDGYHDLRTVLQEISLHDTLRFTLTEGRRISIVTRHPFLPTGRKNLVYTAARKLLDRSGLRVGVRIEIEKRIPLGAGLGGGSSNAAATLVAVNRLLGLNIPPKDLKAIALEIGADVPFFLMRGGAIGYGVGERLRRICIPPLWFILIYPNFEVSTAWAYRNFLLTKKRIHYKIHQFLKTPETICSILRNDLEPVVASRHPQIGEMKEVLSSAGALGTMMSGSGPTVFGVFSGEGRLREAYRRVKWMAKGKCWTVLMAHSIRA
jgi:4-diphosphocytidyl-2-C-methyl-D-erythritol kinase